MKYANHISMQLNCQPRFGKFMDGTSMKRELKQGSRVTKLHTRTTQLL